MSVRQPFSGRARRGLAAAPFAVLLTAAVALWGCGAEPAATALQVHALDRQECLQHPEARTAKGWLKSRWEACWVGHKLVELKCKGCVTKVASVEFDYTLLAFGYDGQRRVDYVLQFDSWKALGGAARKESILSVTFYNNGCGGGRCSPSPWAARDDTLESWAANRVYQWTFTSPQGVGDGEALEVDVRTIMDMAIATPSDPQIEPWSERGLASLRVRFDSAGRRVGKTHGAAFPDFTPTFKLPAGEDPTKVREAMRHLDDALHRPERTLPPAPGKYIPGEDPPLLRLFSEADKKRNRARSTSFCQSPRPPGMQCDEYPFASTYQGAATAPLKPWHGSVRLMPASDNELAGNALDAFYMDYRVLDMDEFHVTVDPADIAPNIRCSIFDDGYTNLVAGADAIFFSGGKACVGNGTAAGECRKWFGRCVTEKGVPVRFRVFDDGGQAPSALSDAVFIDASHRACTPDGGSGTCRKWFGSAETEGGEAVVCRLFGDGFTSFTGETPALFHDGARTCMPDGTAAGTCRKWWGRCQLEAPGPVLPGGGTDPGTDLPDLGPSVRIDRARIAVDADGRATLQARVASGGQPVSVRWSYAAPAGVDPGARCTFSAPTSAATALSCTDDGTFTVTVTASDGVHEPAVASAEVTIPNRPPTLSLAGAPAPWSVHEPGETLTFGAAVTDPEANDAVACSIAWDDGTSERLAPAGGACAFRHRFSAPGMYTVRVAAEDDDGGLAEEERLVVVASRAHGSASGCGDLRDLAAGGATEYRRAHLGFTATNLGAWLGPRGHVDLDLDVGPGDRQRLDADRIEWLVVPELNRFALKGDGRLHGRDGRREVGVLLYGEDACGWPLWRCDPDGDRVRIVIFDGADPYPTAANVLFDSQPGRSLDLDRFRPAASLEPGTLSTWPY